MTRRSLATTTRVVTAAGLEADRLLGGYLRAVAGGASVVVRPTTAFAGLDDVIEQVRRRSSAPTVVTDLATSATLLPAEPEPPQPAGAGNADGGALLAFHTSGSTGAPKCVVYRRDTVEAHAATIARSLGLEEGDDAEGPTWVALPPVRFAYGLSILHSHAVAGVPVRFVDAEWHLPQLMEVARDTTGPIGLYLLPQHVPALLASGLDRLAPGRLHRIVIAGGRLSSASAQAVGARFGDIELTNMYGQAELGPRLALWRGPLSRFTEGDIGHPLPGVELDLRTPEDAARAAGPLMDLHARTPFAMWRYLRPPYREASAGPSATEFVRTGDLARRVGSGLRHEGRADHWINVAGTRVDLALLSALLQQRFDPLLVKASSRPARLGGDAIPVLQLVQGTTPLPDRSTIRRALHAEIGPLAMLCDIRVLERPELGESGK